MEGPCKDCGAPTSFTAEDKWPLCDLCTRVRQAWRLLEDIVDGRIEIPPLVDEEGNAVE